jgi:hypothetical protein
LHSAAIDFGDGHGELAKYWREEEEEEEEEEGKCCETQRETKNGQMKKRHDTTLSGIQKYIFAKEI